MVPLLTIQYGHQKYESFHRFSSEGAMINLSRILFLTTINNLLTFRCRITLFQAAGRHHHYQCIIQQIPCKEEPYVFSLELPGNFPICWTTGIYLFIFYQIYQMKQVVDLLQVLIKELCHFWGGSRCQVELLGRFPSCRENEHGEPIMEQNTLPWYHQDRRWPWASPLTLPWMWNSIPLL